MKTAFITGATGFVGSHLASYLVEHGWRVHALVRPTSSDKVLHDNLIKHRYFGKFEDVYSALLESKPDVVFHLASLVIAEHKAEDIAPLVESNVTLGCHILEAMVRAEIRCIINTGTFSQHGGDEQYNAANLYSATKQAFQDILRFYSNAYPVRAITLKLFDTYGPRDRRRRIFNLFENAYRNGETLNMTPGEQRLDLIYISDVVMAFERAANLLAADQKIHNESFFVGTGRTYTLRQIVDIYQKITGRKLPLCWGGVPYRHRQIMFPFLGPGLPGWQATVDLETGIKKIMEYKNILEETNEKMACQ